MDDEVGKHSPQNRERGESKLRRGGAHCPVCLTPLAKNAQRTRLRRECLSCRAHPSEGKVCAKCGASSIWENKEGAACAHCGLHGSKSNVIR
jgi:hypothetical protein